MRTSSGTEVDARSSVLRSVHAEGYCTVSWQPEVVAASRAAVSAELKGPLLQLAAKLRQALRR